MRYARRQRKARRHCAKAGSEILLRFSCICTAPASWSFKSARHYDRTPRRSRQADDDERWRSCSIAVQPPYLERFVHVVERDSLVQLLRERCEAPAVLIDGILRFFRLASVCPPERRADQTNRNRAATVIGAAA